MTNKGKAVFKGFLNLSRPERDEVFNEIAKEQEQLNKRGILNEGDTVSLGPMPGGCPCCGR